MFWSPKKRRRLRRSSRPARPLRWQYEENEPKSYPLYYDSGHPRPHLSTLPPELHLSIFDNLDPVSSACLGLTNKRFYPMHRSAHRKVGLYEGTEQPLHLLLRDWNPSDLVLDWESERLVSQERYDILQETRRRERERRAYWQNASYYPGSYRHFDRDRDRERERSAYYELVQPRYDEGRRRLRRRGRLERHDIWAFGRR